MDRIDDQTSELETIETWTRKVLDDRYQLHQNIGYGRYAK
jgi:hypothetical protein